MVLQESLVRSAELRFAQGEVSFETLAAERLALLSLRRQHAELEGARLRARLRWGRLSADAGAVETGVGGDGLAGRPSAGDVP